MQYPDDDHHEDVAENDFGYDEWEGNEASSDSHDYESDELETVSQSSSRKKRSFLMPFIFTLAIVGGAGWYYYSEVSGSQKRPPIISLESDIIPRANPLQSESAPSGESFADQHSGTSPAQETENSIQDTSASVETPILTPLPTNLSDRNVSLPRLDQPAEHAQNVSENLDLSETSDANEQSAPLVTLEEEILSKTEEKPSSDRSKNPLDKMNNKEQKINNFEEDQPKLPQENKNLPSLEKQIDSAKISEEKNTSEVQSVSEQAAKAKKIKINAKEAKKESVGPKKDDPQWVIRGAKPQTAVLFDKKTGNTRTVEVGNVIKGLGKIKSIRVENGKWVVKGTIKTITQ